MLAATATVATAHAQTPLPWPFAGGNIENTRASLSAAGAQQLNATTAANLTVKWTFVADSAVLATPTVEQGGLYVTDRGGTLYKIDPATGLAIWGHPLSYYTGIGGGGQALRSSPAIGANGEIVVGDSASTNVIAVNRTTGKLIWKTVVDTNPDAFIHGSAVIYNGIVYIGVTSVEEGLAEKSSTYVPSFRGSLVALNETTGQVLWKFYTCPPGYTGATIWNSQPVVFAAANSMIFATGNNYSIPTAVANCVRNSGNTPALQARFGTKCLDPGDMVDAVVALDLTTGALKWSRLLQGPDTFTGACVAGYASCPNPVGTDFDFSSAPNLVDVPGFVGVADDRGGVSASYLLGAGEKSGMYWGINPYNGGLFWGTFIGHGEIHWGTAVNTNTNTDALIALNNYEGETNLLAGVNGVAQYWNASAWGDVNLKTGKMIWQVPAFGTDLTNPAVGSYAPGAISYSNGVAFAGSSSGYLVALNAATGYGLWSFNTGAPAVSAPAIFNDTLYWGTGNSAQAGSKLYAFSIAATPAAQP